MNFESDLITLLPKRFRKVEAWQVLMSVFGSMLDEVHTEIEGIADLTDKDRCPEGYLNYQAENQGFQIRAAAGTEAVWRKRVLLKTLPYIYRSRGRAGLIEEIIKFFYFYGTDLESPTVYSLWSDDYLLFSPFDGRVSETPTGWTGDDVTLAFSGTLTALPARVRTMSITVEGVSGDTLEAWDNGRGELEGSITAGSIDHTTGAISVTWEEAPKSGEDIIVSYILESGQYKTPHFITFFPSWTYREIGLDEISITPWTGDGYTQDFNTNLRYPVKIETVRVTAQDIYGYAMVLTDDGLGHLTGDAGSGNNTIDYDTGALEVSFDAPVAAGELVTVEYTHKNVYTGKQVFSEMIAYLERYRPVHTVMHAQLGDQSEFWRLGVTRYRVGDHGSPQPELDETIRIGGAIWL